MEIKKIKLSDMKPLEDNIRIHGENQIKHYIRSIKQFGQTKPIILDEDYNILIGNGLYKAMTEMGFEYAEGYFKKGLSKKDKKKLILADNKVYEMGMTSNNQVERFLKEITDTGDFDIVGYEEDILKSIMATPDEILEDMKSYGAFDEQIIKPIEQPMVNQIEQPIHQQIEQPTHQQIDQQMVNQMDQQMVSQSQLNTQIQQPQMSQADTMRTIICPNCGEVIRLD